MDGIKFSTPSSSKTDASRVNKVIEGGWIVAGPEVEKLEAEFASYCGAAYAIAVTSWTTGAFLVLHAWGIRSGDEVIVPSYSFIASANVISHTGATPVFVDIDRMTGNITPNAIRNSITPNTKAILPVDQIGVPCDIDAINEIAANHNLLVLDDAACAIGSRYKGQPVGGLTDASVFSLHARKLVTTGEGGMILTNDQGLADQARLLSRQGMSLSDRSRHKLPSTIFESYPEIGFNFRMTDIQAAVGVSQMERFGEILHTRRLIASQYFDLLSDIDEIQLPLKNQDYDSNFQSFMIGLKQGGAEKRNCLMDALYDRGIPTRRGIMASHQEPAYAHASCLLPETDFAAAHNLLLPIHNSLTVLQQSYIAESIKEILRTID